jgi:hypothetical protein
MATFGFKRTGAWRTIHSTQTAAKTKMRCSSNPDLRQQTRIPEYIAKNGDKHGTRPTA